MKCPSAFCAIGRACSWLSILVALGLILSSCQEQSGRNPQQELETVYSGKTELLVDEEVAEMIEALKPVYDSAFPKADVTLKRVNGREAMSQLLPGKAKGAIIARDYLPDEDSLMKVYEVEKFPRLVLAFDALTFFVSATSPVMSVEDSALRLVMSNAQTPLSMLNGQFDGYKFSCPMPNSSVYGNLMLKLCGGKRPQAAITHRARRDSVMADVKTGKYIGIGLLSQIVKDKSVRALMIGYIDTTGKYNRPVPVHQGYIAQGRYPYEVPICTYRAEDRQNLAKGFFTFIHTDKRYVDLYGASGIVPDFAKIVLVPEEQ